MENQHRIITGYRELSAEEIALMNEIKAHGIATFALIEKVQAHASAQHKATQPSYRAPENDDPDHEDNAIGTECIDTPEQTQMKTIEALRLKGAQPFRWLAIANTDLQTGLMALVRAVAQPTSF